ncbi:putative phytol kinase [Rosa chinensis]|uniref:phytol kinase n=1 Tax=Rosa chinensis TaxID=74649 RepID=A0A2P6SCT0_ROSCH|nr:phytol kinase 1, chloroplastic [Rosa chinensis]PRQ56485.1 putative phytol kinase [Rosa chinensis]
MTLLSFTPSRHLKLNPTTTFVSIVRRPPLNPVPSSLFFCPTSPPLPLHILYRPPRPSLSLVSAPRAASSAGSLLHDAGATALVLAGAYTLVLCFDNLTKRNLLQQSLSRKLVHISSGLLFVLSWPIFSTSTEARYFASVVPLFNGLRLLLSGLSLVPNEGLVKSVTREGNPKELLRGPLYYVLILILSALVFWRESPVGVISLAMMCGGDGVADIMGRRFGSIKIPYNHRKSWAGSISMFVFGFLISLGMLYYYSILGYFNLDWMDTVQKVAFVSLVATVVESLPITKVVDDNISVPLASMAAAYFSFSL